MKTRPERAILALVLFLGFSLGLRAQEPAPPDPAEKPAPSEKPAPAEKPVSAANPAKDEKSKVEIREDRIKSVARKSFLKRYRWELSPLFCLNINDAFYQRIGGGLSASFSPADSLSLEVQGAYVATVQTDMVSFFQKANTALPKVSQLRYYLMGNILWSPVYGKLALFDDIIMFDAYLVGGFGMAYTETGAKMASDIGVGFRYFLNSWLVVKLEVRDIIYTEVLRLDKQRTDFSDIQNHVMLGLGVSFFLPTGFSYEYQ